MFLIIVHYPRGIKVSLDLVPESGVSQYSHSKRIANHVADIALHYMRYNFGLIYQTLWVAPAMEAGIAGNLWSIEEPVGLLD